MKFIPQWLRKARQELLESAAASGWTKVAQFMLACGADIHGSEDAALWLAARFAHTDTVGMLLGAGAHVHAREEAALRAAAAAGHAETVRLLIANGADVHARRDDALVRAARNGHALTVTVLIEAGADASVEKDRSLMAAAIGGHRQTVEVLLGAGVDPRGGGALKLAETHGHTETADLLRATAIGVRQTEAAEALRAARRVEIVRRIFSFSDSRMNGAKNLH